MRLGGTSKSQRASMTSSPLFMRVAESMVILRPIDHVGWLSASAGVMEAKLSRGQGAERPAGRGEDEAAHFRRRAPVQALVQRAVLAVDGQQAASAGPRLRDHQLARHHQRLLVREGHVLAGFERAVGRHQADRAHRGRHHHVRVGMGGHGHRSLFPDADGQPRDVHPAGQVLARGGGGHRHHLRPIPRDLLREPLDVGARGEAHDRESIGKRVHHAQDVASHRTRRPENGDAFFH